MTDRVSKELFNVTHLHELDYAGDKHIESFLEDWFRIVDDQEESLSEKQLERIFYAKIKKSQRLRVYLDKYSMLDEDDAEHSHEFLFESVEKYLKKTIRS